MLGGLWQRTRWTAGDAAALGLWVGVFAGVYLGARRALGARSPKRIWVLTFANAVASSVLGLPVALDLQERGWTLDAAEGDTAFSRLALLSFLAYLLTDLVVGLLEYRQQVTLVMGWMHHLGYATLTAHFLHRGISNSYAAFLLEEIPTACLAAGRLGLLDMGSANLLFALSYVPTRFVYHLYVMARLFGREGAAPPGNPLHVYVYPSYLGLAMNTYWLYAWTRSAMRRYRQRKVLKTFPAKRMTGRRARLASLIRRKTERARLELLRSFRRRASGGSGGPEVAAGTTGSASGTTLQFTAFCSEPEASGEAPRQGAAGGSGSALASASAPALASASTSTSGGGVSVAKEGPAPQRPRRLGPVGRLYARARGGTGSRGASPGRGAGGVSSG